MLGPYRVVEKIGEGGMGSVYKARDSRLDRTVALKLLNGSDTAAPAVRERLRNEARTLSQLNHPHICTLYDLADVVPDGETLPLSYLVMEYVDGETLASRLERGPLSLDRVLLYGAQIADALDKAHRAGVVHGDLKPGNVMLGRSGVKLLDFGLARRRGTALPADWADAATRTLSAVTPDSVAGTLQYLAPEQLDGHPSDERADIFACGAVLYEMLSGRRAFDADTPAGVIGAIMRSDPVPLPRLVPGVPPAVDHLVSVCLAKDPEARWQHAGDLARELRWLATMPEAAAAVESSVKGGAIWKWSALTAVLLLAVAALTAAYVRRGQPEEPPASRTSILLPEGLRFPTVGTVGGGGRLAVSPDGRTLAVVAVDAAGTQMLWLRALAGQSVAPLAGTEGASSPFWSPDSKSIAFVAQGQLKRIDAVGGDAVVVASPALAATGAWNARGEILFTPTATSPLALVQDTGGTPRTVSTLDPAAGDVLHRNPAFLPDGRHFLFVAVGGRNGTEPGRRTLAVGATDEQGPPVPVLDGVAGARFSAGSLLFLRGATLMAQAFDPARFTLTGEARVVTEQIDVGGTAAASFTVSDTGLLAWQPSSTAGSQLVWFDRQGRQLGPVGDAADYADVELSPDARLAAVSVLDPSTNTRDLWIVDMIRGVRTRFTNDKADDVAPIWSPDGSRILFTSNRRGHFDLYEKGASGIGPETLIYADAEEKYPTSWSSNGNVLYWTFNADGTTVQLLPLDGDRMPRTFLPSPVSPGRFAPDGRFVLYYSAVSGRSEVYLVPFPTATRRWQISSTGGNFARWRADGREIFYVGRDNKLMAVTVDTTTERAEIGQPVALFDARPVGARYSFDVAPGGERFLVNTVRGASAVTAITVVQSWHRLLEP